MQNNEMDIQETETLSTAVDARMDVISNEMSQEAEDRASTEAKIIIFRTSLSNLCEPQFSTSFYVRNLPWQIKLEQNLTQIPRTLGFYLRCNGVPQTSTWSCFAVAELRLLNLRRRLSVYFECDAFSRIIRHSYNGHENEAGFASFIPWEDLCDPRRGFVMHNNIEVQAHVKACVPRIAYNVETSVKVRECETVSELMYHFELPQVSAFRGVLLTPSFKIHNMPFQLVIQTIPDVDPTALALFLMCLGDSKYPYWSCYVEAELRLRNLNTNGETCIRTLRYLFCRTKTHCGFRRFLSWKYFLDSKNGFVKHDTAHFEIEVKADATAVSKIEIDRSKPNRARREVKIRCTVYNISQLKSTLYASPFYVRNLPWRIKLAQRTCIGPTRMIQRYLSVYLQCDHNSEQAWCCKVIAVFTLRKHYSEECGRGLHYLFSKEKRSSGFSHFVRWNDVLDPKVGFIRNDSITLVVHVKAEEPCGIKTD